jgi:sugar phosphate isomerase/epimerase
MDIYASTGGLKGLGFPEAGKQFQQAGITKIEFSAGDFVFEPIFEKIEELSRDAKIMLHNYFPPAKLPFVLNLASLDSEITSKSLDFFQNSIDLSARTGAKYYGIHSGFLVDPDVSQLGKSISNKKIANRETALELFTQRTLQLANYAEERGVRLLVENNVLSHKNYFVNNMDILLLSNPREIENYFQEIQGQIGLLLDVGHLKVSCNTLKLDLVQSFKQIDRWTEGYHLSENSGLEDDHQIFDLTAWFLPLLNPAVGFATLEINNSTPEEIANLVSKLEGKFRS